MILVGAALIVAALGLALRSPAIAQDTTPTPATSPATAIKSSSFE